ncbi:VOC family protein [bacterium]|nr:VOC family protein [bacterium]HPF35479.1 VOC family protein [Candidatus Krumholzibacteria bacterium]
MTKSSFLEHVNITVRNPRATAELYRDLFGWTIRWSGKGIHDGDVYHVGDAGSYIAVYSRGGSDAPGDTYDTIGGLNHLGVVVDDLDAVEQAIVAAGFTTRNHASYTPGRRFYFDDPDGIEIEVVTYS